MFPTPQNLQLLKCNTRQKYFITRSLKYVLKIKNIKILVPYIHVLIFSCSLNHLANMFLFQYFLQIFDIPNLNVLIKNVCKDVNSAENPVSQTTAQDHSTMPRSWVKT